jgi:hypothetical protein
MVALAAILAAVLSAAPGPAGADPAALPVRQRTLLLLRVLVYDRNLPVRAPEEVVVGVLFRPGDRESERERDEVLEALTRLADEVVARGRAIRGAPVPWSTAAELHERLAALHPAALWVTGALAPQAAEIARVTAARKVLSGAGTRAAVEAGLAVGIVPGPQRAAILVNTSSARAEGADLDAALLAIAELVTGRK